MPFARPDVQSTVYTGVLTCPHCGKVNTMHAGLGPDCPKPVDGDASLCIRCGQLGVFDTRARKIRLPTAEELREFDALPEVRAACRAWRRLVAH